jgi:hypothetical protein
MSFGADLAMYIEYLVASLSPTFPRGR